MAALPAGARRISTGLTLGDLLARNARFHHDDTAFDDGRRRIGHGAFYARVCRFAAALEARGCRLQDRISMLSMNTIELFEYYGACELAGFIAAPLNVRLAVPELVEVLRRAEPAAVLFETLYTETAASLRAQVSGAHTWICVGGDAPDWAEDYESLVASGAEQGPALRADEDDLAHLIFTSGTTGRPKGCMLAHRESVNKAQMHAADMGITPADRVLLTMPGFHVGAKGSQIGASWRAATVLLHRRFEPAAVLDAIERDRATIVHLAPTMVQSVLETPGVESRDLSSVRVVCYSAAPMPINVLRKGLALMGSVFHQVYGQTEGAVSVLLRSQHRPDGTARERRWLESVGQPVVGTEVRLLDDDGADVPVGTAGEIAYRGGVMFRGYWNDAAETLRTLRDGWLRSGDVGRFDDDGFLYIVDRRKDMIVSGGENVYSREVEQALVTHPDVLEAAVIGVPDARWGEAVRAIVVLRTGATADEAMLVEHSRSRIAGYKRPRSIVFTDTLPKLHNGKIDKSRLRAEFGVAAQSSPLDGITR